MSTDTRVETFRATPVKLCEENVCRSPILVDRGPGREPGKCGRPLWGGDGYANCGGVTHEHAMCSRCWHQWNAFHGPYVTMKANPAAATIDNTGLARLFITRGLDADPLPEVGAELPDVFPAEWEGDEGNRSDPVPDFLPEDWV